ncbi:MAG: hypothetical protein EOO38_06340 [Cytophagaceae bacterium]|nr:MAG: hypothetical protein EOO38_06340 [Cytophagaceae bacterium]
MSIHTVDLSVFNDPRVISYLADNDRRILIGARFALEALQLPLPDCVTRKPAGRPSIAKLMAAADADSGTSRTYRDEKLRINEAAPLR